MALLTLMKNQFVVNCGGCVAVDCLLLIVSAAQGIWYECPKAGEILSFMKKPYQLACSFVPSRLGPPLGQEQADSRERPAFHFLIRKKSGSSNEINPSACLKYIP